MGKSLKGKIHSKKEFKFKKIQEYKIRRKNKGDKCTRKG